MVWVFGSSSFLRILLHLLLTKSQETNKSWILTASWFLRIWQKLTQELGQKLTCLDPTQISKTRFLITGGIQTGPNKTDAAPIPISL